MNVTTRVPARSLRRFRRYYPQIRELAITYEGSSEDIPIRPPDVSAQGMFINTPRHFPEGSVLAVRFRLLHSNYEVCARCEVRYCLPGVGIGVEFVDISEEARRMIEQELKQQDG